ncbi:hypothetical protein NQ176_g10391 [Zarea fungicola]|uniref:Uncharacterized protein n=1 Tax=Zarea fungicola TaxID=93591 RepID=A0ACC1MI32_9HYPO|nr:hypothetical protein NQ176_g10391 [Lecanicillium fungicola]
MRSRWPFAIAARQLLRHASLSSPTSLTARVLPSCRHTSSRLLQTTVLARSGAASNPAMAFPCLDAMEDRSATLRRASSTTSSKNSASSSSSSNEPSYTSGVTQVHHVKEPLTLDWGGVLPEFDIAYETWGKLNSEKSNAVLLHTGLSASSHAHSTPENTSPGCTTSFAPM